MKQARGRSTGRGVLAAVASVLLLVAGSVGCNRGPGSLDEQAEGTIERALDRLMEPKKEIVQIPPGTSITFVTATRLSSQTSAVGDEVVGRLARDVVLDGKTVVPSGTEILGTVSRARPVRKIGGRALLAFEVNLLVTPSGQEVPVVARFAREGRSETARDTAAIATGAVVGAIIGNQVEGDTEGRAVGGLLGAGIGTAIAADTKGEEITLPVGTMIRLELLEPTAIQFES